MNYAKKLNETIGKDKKKKNRVHIGIFDEHNYALFFWVRAHKLGLIPRIKYDGEKANSNEYNLQYQGLPLLHIDSHSDAQIPQHYFNFKKFRDIIENPSNYERVQYVNSKNQTKFRHVFNDTHLSELLEATSIGDFIPVGQYLGLVSPKVVWLQSDFEGGGYNFGQGRFNAELGVRKSAVLKGSQSIEDIRQTDTVDPETTYLCYRKSDGYKWTRKINRNGKKTVTKRLGNISQIAKAGVCSPYEEFNQPEKETIPIQWDVFRMKSLFNRTTGEINKNAQFFNSTSYLLDIDLDYFSTDDEMLFNMVPRKQYAPLFKVFAEMVEEDKIMCYGKNVLPETKHMNNTEEIKKFNRKRMSDFLHEMFFKGVLFDENAMFTKQPVQSIRFDEESVFTKELLNMWCEGKLFALQHLYELSKFIVLFLESINYFHLSLLQMNYRFPTVEKYCNVNQMFGVCPSGLPSKYLTKDQIIDEMNKLERIIVAQEKLPAYITISRSVDAYLPRVLHHFIETETLKMLDRAFHTISPNVTVDTKYFAGYDATSSVYENDARIEFFDRTEREASFIRKALKDMNEPVGIFIPAVNYKLFNMALMTEFLESHGISMDDFVQDLSLLKEFLKWKMTHARGISFSGLKSQKPQNVPPVGYTVPQKRPRLCMVIVKDNSTENESQFDNVNCWVKQLNETFDRELVLDVNIINANTENVTYVEKLNLVKDHYSNLFPTYFKSLNLTLDEKKPLTIIVDPSCITFDLSIQVKNKKRKKYINLEDSPLHQKYSGKEKISFSQSIDEVISHLKSLAKDGTEVISKEENKIEDKMAYIEAQKEKFNKQKVKHMYSLISLMAERSNTRCLKKKAKQTKQQVNQTSA